MTLPQFLLISGIMIVYGLVIGFIAGFIWKGKRPIGVWGDYIVAIGSCLVFGLGAWFIIPELGFKSQTIKLLGVFVDTPFAALLILWLIRKIKR